MNEENRVRKGILLAIAALALLAGCGPQGTKTAGTPADTKWKGLPYRLTFDTKAVAKPDTKAAKTAKASPAVIVIPPTTYIANPEALENRAILVMRFTTGPEQTSHLMVGTPVDIRGESGALPADYLVQASKSISDYLTAHCIDGKVKVSVALARSSVKPQAEDAEVDSKRLSDWLSFDAVAKKPHSKC